MSNHKINNAKVLRMKIENQLRGYLIFIMVFFLTTVLYAQPDKGEFEKWGQVGVGKLVTTISNTNVIASGRFNYPEMAKFPALEYPFNSNIDGRHIYYGTDVSFHVGGFTLDKGPSFDGDPNKIDMPLVESGDRGHYTFYKGFHFDGHPEYHSSDATVGLAVSDDPSTWPSNWPQSLPITDPFLDRYYPNYPTAYTEGIASPIPIDFDSNTGFPGAGPNKYSLPGKFAPGEVVADQEIFTVSYSRNRSDDTENGRLMIYTTLRGMSWQEELAEDFIYWIFTVTNMGTEPIEKTYLGIYANLDFPWSSYQDFGTYSESESWAFDTYDVDTTDGKEYKIGYGWDGDGDVEGANQGAIPYQKAKLVDETPLDKVALSGVVFLQTPKNDSDSDELGVKSWDAFLHSHKGTNTGIGNTVDKFYWLNVVNSDEGGGGTDPDDLNGDRIDDWTWEKPFPVGNELTYENGKRSAMTMNTGEFTIMPGETDTLICVTVMGDNRQDLFKNAQIARQIFMTGWTVPKSPIPPKVTTISESGKITLRWGNISENDSLNTLLGRQAFEGYKVYRSTDGGSTWGSLPITDENGTVVDYVPMNQSDLDNGISGASPVRPYFNRGTDSGLEGLLSSNIFTEEIFLDDLNQNVTDTVKYEFVDESVVNGFEYRYAVVAYGAGAEEVGAGLPPLQNSRTSGDNVISAIPFAPASTTADELNKIKVVPNPYRVVNPQETDLASRMIKFTHLPEECTISIFNVSGELIRTLYHDQNSVISSEKRWNLRSEEDREVAPGLYFYHLSSSLGSRIGKFVIIK